MKPKRKITVDGKNYIWTLDGNSIYVSGKCIIVTLENTSYSRLYLDPYAYDFEIRPATIARSIKAAREKFGWNQENNSGEIKLNLENGKTFIQVCK
jgi:hypothetical protein